MGTLTVIFETHATSLDNEGGLASGWFDAPLSAAGEEQARELGARRSSDSLAAVFCSDLVRSYRTAEIAFANRPLPIVRDRRLRECDYGSLTRAAASDIEQLRARHVTTPFPNGESYQQAVNRIAPWVEEAVRRFDDGTILVIGHRATFYGLEHLLKGVALEQAVRSAWTWQPGWTYYVRSAAGPP